MNIIAKLICFCSLVALVTACATASKMNNVQIGMSKDEVIKVMGDPVSTSSQGDREYLNYALAETSRQAQFGMERPYYVRLINGKVESYGRSGDFDSTKDPTVRIKKEEIIKADIETTSKKDLYSELKKLKQIKDDGLINEQEFESEKKELLERY